MVRFSTARISRRPSQGGPDGDIRRGCHERCQRGRLLRRHCATFVGTLAVRVGGLRRMPNEGDREGEGRGRHSAPGHRSIHDGTQPGIICQSCSRRNVGSCGTCHNGDAPEPPELLVVVEVSRSCPSPPRPSRPLRRLRAKDPCPYEAPFGSHRPSPGEGARLRRCR